MTDNETPSSGTGPSGNSSEAPAPVVKRGRGISLVWVIPIVALIVGAGVAFDAYRNRGVAIVISLPDAEWVEAGKTTVQYLSVKIGTVDDVVLRKDHKGVDLHCTVDKRAERVLTEGAKFWLVHPRVGAAGVSGLGTLLSGAYLAMRPGPYEAKTMREFVGLEVPPLESDHAPALTVLLHSEELNGLGVGSPVYYREVPVGKVEQYKLEEDGSGVLVRLYFDPEHAKLVREDSRFWNAGGIQISGNLSNLEIQTESLAAVLAGGIAFDSPRGEKSKPAKTDAKFWLHSSKAETLSHPFQYGGLKIFVESRQLGSVTVGSPIYYREIQVGAVTSHELVNDSRHVRIGLNIQPRYATLVRTNSVFWNASGISAHLGIGGLKIHTESVAAILNGGIAFATPKAPADSVKVGSVFKLHDEIKEDWLGWSPLIWRGAPGNAPPAEAGSKSKPAGKHSAARFFHHEDKDEESSNKAGESNKDSSQEAAHHEKRHGFFRNLFHKDKKE